MNWSIRNKLLLGGSAVLITFVVATCIAYQQSRIVAEHLAHVKDVALPLRESAMEMHASFLGAELSTVGYLLERNPINIARVSEDSDNFNAHMGHFSALANTPRLHELGSKAKEKFARFRELSKHLMQKRDDLTQKTTSAHDAFVVLEQLFANQIIPAMASNAFPGSDKWTSIIAMKASFGAMESSYWSLLNNYDQKAEMRVRAAVTTLLQHRDRYSQTMLSPKEKEWMGEIDRQISVIKTNVDESIDLTASTRQLLEEFTATRNAMTDILVNGIQMAVGADLNESQKKRSGVIAWMNAMLIAFLMSGLSIGTVVGIAVYRGVTTPIHRLNTVTQALAHGETVTLNQRDYHGEFGSLMQSFDQMVAARTAAEKGIRELNADLAQRNITAAHAMNMSNLLQTAVDMHEAEEILTRAAQQLLKPHSGALYLTVPSLNRLDRLTAWGEHRDRYASTLTPEECWGMRRGAKYSAHDSHVDMYCHHVHEDAMRQAYVCVPMMAHGISLGLLHVNFAPVAGNALDIEKRRVDHFANQVALALSNLKLRQRLREQSIIDTLTGLYNRRYLEESLEREVAGATRDKRPLALFMLDVDHFKQFNDQFGHEGGDAVLQALGRTLRESARRSDLVARYGGEEFTVLLPNTPLTGAFEWGERLRDTVAKMHVNATGQSFPPITISLGLAVLPDHGQSGQALLHEADMALYEAKRSGRNRLVVRSQEALPPSMQSDGVVVALPRMA